MKYQHYEANNDQWICEEIYPGKKGGFFVEAGVLNGVNNSATYVLEKYLGWKGITVEPDINLHTQARKNRQICEPICLGDRSGYVTFVASGSPGYSGVKNYLLETEEYAKKGGWLKDEWRTGSGINSEYQVRMITLEDLLDMHGAPRRIDYTAFDMEGAEHHVLQAFSFERYQLMALSVEGERCTDLLGSKGYIQVKNKFNTDCKHERYFLHPDLYHRLY